MGMNGSRGRAKTLAAIRRRQTREAAAAGVDPTDRKAVRAFHDNLFNEFADRTIAAAARKDPDDR